MSRRETVSVAVDVREPTHVIDAVIDNEDIDESRLDELESGDLVIDDRIAFERKTPSDFASSMTNEDDHLRDQIERMVDQWEAAYVLIEGRMSDFETLRHTNVPAAALRGFVASIEARYGVSVLFCDDREQLVDMAVRIGRKHKEDPPEQLRIESSVAKDAPLGKRMWGCLSQIGEKRADALYEEFGSPTGFWLMVDEPIAALAAVDGIGEKTARDIVIALTSEQPNEIDT